MSGITVTCGPGVLASNSTNAAVISTLDATHFALAYKDSTNGSFNAAVVVNLASAAANRGLGVASASATAGQTVSVVFQGIAGGFTGLSAGTVYYAYSDGSVTTTITPNPLGVAISATQILLNNSSNVNSLTQFFGDAVFLNDFRITEAADGPQALIFQNQRGEQIARFNENGDLSITGQLFAAAGGWTQSDPATSVGSLLAGPFRDASAALQTALQSVTASAVRILGDVVRATFGIFDTVFAKKVHTDALCVGDTCVTPEQFHAMAAAAGHSSAAAKADGSNGETSTSSSATVASSTPPVIHINGENPAHVNVGDTYPDLGATAKDSAGHDLTVHTFLNGALVSDIVLDTVAPATDTIEYVSTDSAGITSTSTRTVIIDAPGPTPE